MLELGFSTDDLARTRFAISPILEVVTSVRVLKDPGSHALHLPWVKAVGPRVAAAWSWLAPLTELVAVPSWYIPDFLTPSPHTPVPDLDDELDRLAATPPERLRVELDRLGSPAAAELYRRPADGLARLVDTIRSYWDMALAEHWPRLQALLEGEVFYRARRLAEGGAATAFNDLHPRVSWRDDTLSIRHRFYSGSRRLDGQGLVLIPSAFVWPSVFSSSIPPVQPTLTYPPRGVGALWERGGTRTPAALVALIGRSRAALLAELGAPASTTELARRTGLSAGGVSQHLGVLHAAGLVSRHRAGRHVLYARTPVAESLIA